MAVGMYYLLEIFRDGFLHRFLWRNMQIIDWDNTQNVSWLKFKIKPTFWGRLLGKREHYRNYDRLSEGYWFDTKSGHFITPRDKTLAYELDILAAKIEFYIALKEIFNAK